MSSKTKTVSMGAFDTAKPIPFVEKKPQPRSSDPERKGATYKTATAAARAAEDARAGARMHAEQAALSSRTAQTWCASLRVDNRRTAQVCWCAVAVCAGLVAVNAAVCFLITWALGR